MSVRHRIVKGGVAIIATVLMGHGIVAAGQPVHEVQIVASRYTFEPATVQVAAGDAVSSLLCLTSFLIIPHSAKAGSPLSHRGSPTSLAQYLGNRFACGLVYMSDIGVRRLARAVAE